MAASVARFLKFFHINLSTLFKKFDQCTPKTFTKNWSVCRPGQACDEKQQLWFAQWRYLQKTGRVEIHV